MGYLTLFNCLVNGKGDVVKIFPWSGPDMRALVMALQLADELDEDAMRYYPLVPVDHSMLSIANWLRGCVAEELERYV